MTVPSLQAIIENIFSAQYKKMHKKAEKVKISKFGSFFSKHSNLGTHHKIKTKRLKFHYHLDLKSWRSRKVLSPRLSVNITVIILLLRDSWIGEL